MVLWGKGGWRKGRRVHHPFVRSFIQAAPSRRAFRCGRACGQGRRDPRALPGRGRRRWAGRLNMQLHVVIRALGTGVEGPGQVSILGRQWGASGSPGTSGRSRGLGAGAEVQPGRGCCRADRRSGRPGGAPGVALCRPRVWSSALWGGKSGRLPVSHGRNWGTERRCYLPRATQRVEGNGILCFPRWGGSHSGQWWDPFTCRTVHAGDDLGCVAAGAAGGGAAACSCAGLEWAALRGGRLGLR